MNEAKPLVDWVVSLGGFGVLLICIWLVGKRYLVLGRELTSQQEASAKEVATLIASHARELAAKDERLSDLRGQLAEEKGESKEWKSAALSNRSLAHKATDATVGLASALSQQSSGTGGQS